MSRSITASNFSGCNSPTFDWIICRSAVNILLGRILLLFGRLPIRKSLFYRALEKGNGTTTTSPFTNLAMLRLPQELANLLPVQIHSRGKFLTMFVDIELLKLAKSSERLLIGHLAFVRFLGKWLPSMAWVFSTRFLFLLYRVLRSVVKPLYQGTCWVPIEDFHRSRKSPEFLVMDE